MINFLSKDIIPNATYYSAGFNIVAACLLILAVIPCYLDAKKSRKTYGVETKFFKFFFYGGVFVWFNSLIMAIGKIPALIKGSDTTNIVLFIMFCVFLVSNSISAYVNYFSLKVKKANLEGAAKFGISEQEYWEKHVVPTLKQPIK